MKKQTFSLKPFTSLAEVEIKGDVARHINTLVAHYEIIGNLLIIDIPERKQKPSRVKGLWENTCCELFVAARDCDQYWEVNLSPSGDWNVFRFERYEEDRCFDNLREELLVTSLPFRTQKQQGSLLLDFEISLDKIIREDQLLDVGVSAVVKFSKSYWALTHRDSVPNFHRRDGFNLKL